MIDGKINEENESTKEFIINRLKIDDTIDFSFSGYPAQLLSIFNYNELFFLEKIKHQNVLYVQKNCE